MVCFYPVICSVVLNLGTSTIRTIISCDISLKCFYLIFFCDRLTLIAFFEERNHNNYSRENDKDKWYSCKKAALIGRLIGGWLRGKEDERYAALVWCTYEHRLKSREDMVKCSPRVLSFYGRLWVPVTLLQTVKRVQALESETSGGEFLDH